MSEEDQAGAEKALQHREYVLQEFVDSERVYVERLRVAVEDYLQFIRAGSVEEVPVELKSDTLTIFSSLPEIYSFHHDVFLPALEDCHGNPDQLVECFQKHNAHFKLYLTYCKNKLNSDTVRAEYEQFFASRQTVLGHKLSIEDLLIVPVQRLPKYQLLIRDLHKDTKKANLDTSKIEATLALMKEIPKETNDLIVLSLIRGMSRANIVSHGSLWQQAHLLVCEKGSREEMRQVFLFDHRIMVALLADRDGFYHYLTCLKLLNGLVIDMADSDATKFGFMEEGGRTFHFKATSSQFRAAWVANIQSILASQTQMRKALVFGRRLSPNLARVSSVALEWSDSDSSVDSMPGSDSDHDDWPEHTGFHSLHEAPVVKITASPPVRRETLPACNNVLINNKGQHRGRSKTLTVDTTAASVSPSLLRRVFSRNQPRAEKLVKAPFPSAVLSRLSLRSPGAFPRRGSNRSLFLEELQPEFSMLVAKETQPAVAEQLYTPPAGQVVVAEDSSKSEVWRVRVVTGVESGREMWVQTNCFEQYSAEINTQPVKKLYSTVSELARGRFAEIKLVKCKTTKRRFVLKEFSPGQSEEHFVRELCIARRLRHRNLVAAVMGFRHNRVSICMEFVNGRPLYQHLSRKASVTESNVCVLTAQLLQALHYLHSHTILHLDVRHHNIMVDISGGVEQLKLLDFGAARHFGSGGEDTLYSNHEVSFDYQFVAPEVFRQLPVATGTDLWGVGIVVLTIFHGNTPFRGESNVRTIANVTAAHYDVPHPPLCSQQALDLLQSIFVPNPRDRPTAEQALNSVWITNATSFHDNTVNLIQLKEYLLDN